MFSSRNTPTLQSSEFELFEAEPLLTQQSEFELFEAEPMLTQQTEATMLKEIVIHNQGAQNRLDNLIEAKQELEAYLVGKHGPLPPNYLFPNPSPNPNPNLNLNLRFIFMWLITNGASGACGALLWMVGGFRLFVFRRYVCGITKCVPACVI